MSAPYADFLDPDEHATQPSIDAAPQEAPVQVDLSETRRVIRDIADGVLHLTVGELSLVLAVQVAVLVLAAIAGGLIGHAIP